MSATQSKIFVVEHLDPELEGWSALEYAAIAKESLAAGAQFRLSSVPQSLVLPEILRASEGLVIDHKSVEDIFEKNEVCLLDPAATNELSPEDGEKFRIFLFGGILGKIIAARGQYGLEFAC